MDQKTDKLIKIIDFWKREALNDSLFPRDLTNRIDIKSIEVVDIIGPRRSGKSSVLKLLMRKLPPQSCLYINFEDPFFFENNSPSILEEIVSVYENYFSPDLKYLFFDEIQNIQAWEKSVRKMRDAQKYKIFVTGSSSKLLSSEISSVLSGRHLSYKLLPLSFREYMSFKGVIVPDEKSFSIQSDLIAKMLKDYLVTGGFPQIVLTENFELLKQYYSDIVQKDIFVRYNVRDRETLQNIGVFLMTNSSKIVSAASLRRAYGKSHQLVANYVKYFLETLLCFEIRQYYPSLKSRQKSLPKFFSVDPGMARSVSASFSDDRGRILETAVFLELLRREAEIYYWKQQSFDIDFIVIDRDGQHQVIQVCTDLSSPETMKRELSSISKVADRMGISSATIVTMDRKEVIDHHGVKVFIIPAYEWFTDLGTQGAAGA
ncbi:MAG TPA: ATP-binding protein [Chryseolinea sp.]|uniref:AAA+ ATPase domain-containing protein n=1 Tax=Candidatus Taylorbacteria bacterium RIFCSPLOWO2_12_FULL_43_20 TaxID=1802332 RepID=A0A1G2P173_9BACT|nr:MAG: hypothetical protein A3G52_02580 [Candidatus Taylorbacteria bacterium RIFCSPLOWO2_12_FULL_43_20]HKZ37831.1 ATP-binding protein [Chryseolinea sp.]